MTKLGNSSTQPECHHRSNDADTEMGPERLRNVLEMSQLRQGGGRNKPKWSQSNALSPGPCLPPSTVCGSPQRPFFDTSGVERLP